MVLVTNGGGFTLDRVTDFLLASVTADWRALPENAAGASQLNDALARLRARPAAGPTASLPPVAGEISGRTFVFGSDVPIRWLRVDFAGQAEATAAIDFVREPETRVFGVGLDNRFQPSQSGRPLVARGEWIDETTLLLEIDEGPGIAPHSVRLSYARDTVLLEGISVFGTVELSITGQLEDCSD